MPRKSRVASIAPAATPAADIEIAVAGARPRHNRQRPDAVPEAAKRVGGCIPRISRLMALAIKFDDVIVRGEVRDYADLARLGYVTRARMTQIMNLLHLAPDLQEEILFLSDGLGDRVIERNLRQVLTEIDWERQRWIWRRQYGNVVPSITVL
jgi:hypothetical protein